MRNDHWYRALSIDPIVEKKAAWQRSFPGTRLLILEGCDAAGMLKPRGGSIVAVHRELILNFVCRLSFGKISTQCLILFWRIYGEKLGCFRGKKRWRKGKWWWLIEGEDTTEGERRLTGRERMKAIR